MKGCGSGVFCGRFFATLLTNIDRHGKQGVLNTASNSQLENEFGTKNEDEVVKKILEKGDIQTSEVRA